MKDNKKLLAVSKPFYEEIIYLIKIHYWEDSISSFKGMRQKKMRKLSLAEINAEKILKQIKLDLIDEILKCPRIDDGKGNSYYNIEKLKEKLWTISYKH